LSYDYASLQSMASWSIDLLNNFLLQPVESGSVDTNYFLTLARYRQNDLRLIHSTGPGSIIQYTTELSLSSALPLAAIVLGSNIFPDSVMASDPQFFLGSQGTAAYCEFVCQTNTSTGLTYNASSLVTDLGPVPDDLTSASYVHNPDLNKSYLSYRSGSGFASYSWTWDEQSTGIAAADFQQLTGIKGRIDAVLTSGQLLSFEDNRCIVYGPAGNKLYDFPFGDLKFCYERWDPTDLKFKLYFSLAYWIYGREEKADQLYVEVYAIPTASLASLR
jgi:hypothetical protein